MGTRDRNLAQGEKNGGFIISCHPIAEEPGKEAASGTLATKGLTDSSSVSLPLSLLLPSFSLCKLQSLTFFLHAVGGGWGIVEELISDRR